MDERHALLAPPHCLVSRRGADIFPILTHCPASHPCRRSPVDDEAWMHNPLSSARPESTLGRPGRRLLPACW